MKINNMTILPRAVDERSDIDCRLGIKSSLSRLSSVVALCYALYCSSERNASIEYADEIQGDDGRYLILKSKYADLISAKYHVGIDKLNENPLLKSQLESLQVGLSLLFKVGVVRFSNYPNIDTKERTGRDRYSKTIEFSMNMNIIDLYISSWSDEIAEKELSRWLCNEPLDSKFSSGLKQLLTIFSEQTLFKLRSNDEEIVFQQEGIYREILSGNNVVAKDSTEDVGPFRIFKSFVREGLHSYLKIVSNAFSLKENHNLSDYNDLVQVSLNLSPQKISTPNRVLDSDNHLQRNSGSLTYFDIDNPYRQYITAIKSKPFLLLAGISGTGKSRIVRELARSCWEEDSEEYRAQKPRNFEIIQVKPNWHDSSELLGYVSRINGERFIVGPFLRFMVKAIQEPDIPYFLCLDEMNLAPVEQYFAEYLSVIESRKLTDDGIIVTDPIIDFDDSSAYLDLINQLFSEEEGSVYKKRDGKKLTLPENLIVIGTVNMDETTFSFSRKVLDRAMTIEMNEVDLSRGLDSKYEPIGKQGYDTLVGSAVEGVDVYGNYEDVCNRCINYLSQINNVLEGTPFKVAYRTRNEVLLYVVNNLPYAKSTNGETLPKEFVIARALDEITSMKILSRIEGDESRVGKSFLNKLSETINEGLFSISGLQYGSEKKPADEEHIEWSISLAKLSEMNNKLSASGYTSYWS